MDAQGLREKMKEKAARLAGGSDEWPGSQSTKPPTDKLNAEYKTGARPISKQALKTGGKVQGEAAKHHAGRVARKSGGKVDKIGNDIINRNVKDANEEREGKKHVGGWNKGGRTGKLYGGGLYGMENQHTGKGPFGLKKGGKVKKAGGGILMNDEDVRGVTPKGSPLPDAHVENGPKGMIPVKETVETVKKDKNGPVFMTHSAIQGGGGYVPKDIASSLVGPGKNFEGMIHPVAAPMGKKKASGGRTAKQSGGSTKGKTQINILIAPQGQKQEATPVEPPMDAPPMPMPMKAAAPAPMAAPPGPPAGLEAALNMPRKDGGKVIHMDHGAGGGLGRLEKIKKYGHKA